MTVKKQRSTQLNMPTADTGMLPGMLSGQIRNTADLTCGFSLKDMQLNCLTILRIGKKQPDMAALTWHHNIQEAEARVML